MQQAGVHEQRGDVIIEHHSRCLDSTTSRAQCTSQNTTVHNYQHLSEVDVRNDNQELEVGMLAARDSYFADFFISSYLPVFTSFHYWICVFCTFLFFIALKLILFRLKGFMFSLIISSIADRQQDKCIGRSHGWRWSMRYPNCNYWEPLATGYSCVSNVWSGIQNQINFPPVIQSVKQYYSK